MSMLKRVRALLKEEIDTASGTELSRILGALDGSNDPAIHHPRGIRFTRLDAQRRPTTCKDWVAVYDAATELIWTRSVLPCGRLPWKEALAAASKVDLFGKSTWRAPTVGERSFINEYDRFNPALNTEYFDAGGADYEWTSTPDAEDPSDYAWIVDLHDGSVLRGGQSLHDYVRAVLAGQSLALGL